MKSGFMEKDGGSWIGRSLGAFGGYGCLILHCACWLSNKWTSPVDSCDENSLV